MHHVRACQFQVFFNLNNFIVNNILKCLRFDVLCYAFLTLSMQMLSMCCRYFSIFMLLLLLSTPLHQRAASRVQHPKSCGSQQSLPHLINLIVKKKKVLIEVLSTILEPWSLRYKCAFYS